MRIKLTISYDGTDYCGWQVQNNGTTIQQLMESAVFDATGETVRVTGSGRTDAGVHARGQVAHFDTDSTIPPEKFYRALNTHLPNNIRVLKSELANDDFNSCTSAKEKTYSYSFYVSNVELPLMERYSLRLDKMPDIEKMEKSAEIFVGEHDFKCFNAAGSGAKTTVRTIYKIDIKVHENSLKIYVTGNGFLYNMVRILAGTLIEAGYDRISDNELREMLVSGNRKLGGKTLLAKGLCLEEVKYK